MYLPTQTTPKHTIRPSETQKKTTKKTKKKQQHTKHHVQHSKVALRCKGPARKNRNLVAEEIASKETREKKTHETERIDKEKKEKNSKPGLQIHEAGKETERQRAQKVVAQVP
jgi:hypothetical protein